MKRIVIIAFIFSCSFLNAQDTIIFKNNPNPVICKIRGITQTNIFYIYNGEYLSDYLSNVKYCSRPTPQVNSVNTANQPNSNIPPPKHDAFSPAGYIALSIGAGFPLGNYKDSGFANTGIKLSLTGAEPFKGSDLGVTFKLDYGNNTVDQTALLSYFQNGLQNQNLSCSIASVGDWSYVTTLAGLCFILPGKDFSFEFKALGGLMFATSAGLNLNVDENNSFVGTISQPASSAIAICFNAGIGLRYKILPELSAIANFDYEYANPKFSLTASAVVNTSSGVMVIPTSADINQVYELANLTIGLAWTPFKTPSK